MAARLGCMHGRLALVDMTCEYDSRELDVSLSRAEIRVGDGEMWQKKSSIHVDRVAATRLKSTPLANNDEKNDSMSRTTGTKSPKQKNWTKQFPNLSSTDILTPPRTTPSSVDGQTHSNVPSSKSVERNILIARESCSAVQHFIAKVALRSCSVPSLWHAS